MDAAEALRRRAIARVNSEGVSWDALAGECEDIIVFGSASVALDTDISDIDILCIGTHRRVKTRRLDLIGMSAKEVRLDDWLGSELAGHIAEFGVPLLGTASWRTCVQPGAMSRVRKQSRIVRLANAVERHRNSLGATTEARYLTTLRREAQRYSLLLEGRPIPPTAMLESAVRADARSTVAAELTRATYNDSATHLETLLAVLTRAWPAV